MLLENLEPAEVSIYDLAKALHASPPSIYHFFPDVSLVFLALAERYLAEFMSISMEMDQRAETWIEQMDILFGRVRGIYNARKPLRKVLLGSGYSPDVRQRDFAGYSILAQRIIEAINQQFELPNVPNLSDRIIETLAINDAIWMLACYRSGYIDDEGAICSSRARTAYLRLFLPEILARRTP